MTDLTGHVFGDYELHTLYRTGGMSTVYQARHCVTGQVVAVKVLKPELATPQSIHLERFSREGALLRQLNHPNIVQVLDVIETHNQSLIVMEYVPGGSLRDVLSTTPQLPIDRVLWIALDLADALTRAHRLDIIHRDLKPANVLIAEDGTPRLTDFGISQLTGEERMTGTGRVTGTPRYLSPEAIDGQRIDERSDIWAFGVMLFEMLAGRVPFEAQLLTQLFYAILHEPIPDLEALCPNAPVGLVDLIYRMLEKDPCTRIPSVRLVGMEIEALLRTEDMVATVLGEDVERHTVDGVSVFVTPTPPSNAPLHNLPVQTTEIVGREEELAEIARLLSETNLRLLTILGPGGMGKTRLALETAKTQACEFEHGAWFVPLAAIGDPDHIVLAIAEAVGFQFHQDDSPREQLLNYLREKAMLLVLDNFEHLIGGADLVTAILQAAPGVKVLATSRERLNLSGETVFTLGGLTVYDCERLEDSLDFAAVKLFISSARRAVPRFELQAQHIRFVTRICRLVDGMPLGIVLSAAWVDMLSLEEIADEVEHDLDFLDTTLQDMPDRHRSMRALFQSIWVRLEEPERNAYMKLSVFHGGFTRRAAQAVAGVSLRGLTALANKSLIRRDPKTGRYELHELLRQYGAEQLEKTGLADTVRETHSAYYLDALAQRQKDLAGPHVDVVLDEIASDLENVHAAWSRALNHGNVSLIGSAQNVLGTFLSVRVRIQEAIAVYEHAIGAYNKVSSNGEELEIVVMRAQARNKLGHLYTKTAAYDEALEEFQLALTEAEGVNDLELTGRVLANIGSLFLHQGEAIQAKVYYQRALSQ